MKTVLSLPESIVCSVLGLIAPPFPRIGLIFFALPLRHLTTTGTVTETGTATIAVIDISANVSKAPEELTCTDKTPELW